MNPTDFDTAHCLNEIVRIGNEVDATINQGMVAGTVLCVTNTLFFLVIADDAVPVALALAYLVISVASQFAIGGVTWMPRLRRRHWRVSRSRMQHRSMLLVRRLGAFVQLRVCGEWDQS
jgi:hypothetical protein